MRWHEPAPTPCRQWRGSYPSNQFCSELCNLPSSRTPEPIKQRSISDTKNRTGFPEGIPYAGLRKAVASEQGVAMRQRNVKNLVRNVGSTPSIISPPQVGLWII